MSRGSPASLVSAVALHPSIPMPKTRYVSGRASSARRALESTVLTMFCSSGSRLFERAKRHVGQRRRLARRSANLPHCALPTGLDGGPHHAVNAWSCGITPAIHEASPASCLTSARGLWSPLPSNLRPLWPNCSSTQKRPDRSTASSGPLSTRLGLLAGLLFQAPPGPQRNQRSIVLNITQLLLGHCPTP